MNLSDMQTVAIVLVVICWVPIIKPVIHALLAVISWHLLFVYAMAKHKAFGEIKWRNLPKHMLKEFWSWLGCVPMSCSNDMFCWGGIFKWHVKPYQPEQESK